MASPQPRIGVVTYPGSQDDRDALWALAAVDAEAVPVWHEERELPDLDAVVVPGGFSYGDYLRCGAIARFSPATAAIVEFANAGGLVLGICNGFQILCEAGLLPGVLLRNESLRFVCKDVTLRVERNDLPATYLWHESHELENCDLIIVPGGFAYGDYLRTGAIAKFSPVMESVKKFAAGGGLVMGICNGFQILCESGLLPGALLRNSGLKYVCKTVNLRVDNADTPFTNQCRQGEVLEIPIGHMEGNYFCDEQTLGELQREHRVVFRYAAPLGEIPAEANPNGSLDNIAGICSPGRNVLGMMPHPERNAEPLLGNADGLKIIQSVVNASVTK